MRNAQGYATITDPDRGLTELDTFTCNHCNCVKHVKPRENPEDIGGLCKVCMKLICSKCVGQPCVPFLEKIARLEAKFNNARYY